MMTLLRRLTQRQKATIFLFIDVVLTCVSLWAALFLFPDVAASAERLNAFLLVLPYLMAVAVAASLWLQLPFVPLKAYDGTTILRTGVFAASVAAVAYPMGAVVGLEITLGMSVVLGMCLFLTSVVARLMLLEIVMAIYRRGQPTHRVLIYGAGVTGVQLAQALRTHEQIFPVGFVDDNLRLQGSRVVGLTVYKPTQFTELAKSLQVDRVLLAMPSVSLSKQTQIARKLQDMGLEVQRLPSYAQLIERKPLVDKLEDLQPHSFLNRLEVARAHGEDVGMYRDKVVLISGAGGSIGSELGRQVLEHGPSKMILYELNEFALYTVDKELRPLAEAAGIELVVVLGSVTDARQVRLVLDRHTVDVVLHAAAYKHVHLVEANPLAGLANNVFGTHTLARLSVEQGVSRFILVSSDKAVRPRGVMGASKRLAEQVVQDFAVRHGSATIFSIVRFGNVLGSSGSVIPLFRDQISQGGPVTLTDPNATRYFMTLSEAVRLVLRAGAMAQSGPQSGDVYVLDMGKPVSLLKLARQMIEAAGYTPRDADHPNGEIEIQVIGMRPGEKLHEELSLSTRPPEPTETPKVFRVDEPAPSELAVASVMRGLQQACASGDEQAARDLLSRWVEGYATPVVHNRDVETTISPVPIPLLTGRKDI